MKCKKTISVLLSAAIVFSAFSMTLNVTATGSIPATITTQNIVYDSGYVGLGDSIAHGYGTFKGDSYVDMLGGLLLSKGHAQNAVVQYKNYGQDGDESSHLLMKLRNSPEVQYAVKNSKFVTISIGGNNIMLELGRQAAIAVGIDPETNPNYINDTITYINNNKITGAAKVVARFNSTAFKNKMNEILAAFSADVPGIVSEIKKLSPNTRIIFQTLYCPTKFIFLSSFLDNYIQQLNNIITSNASTYNYQVADIHSAFKNYSGSEDLTYTAVMSGFFDPHPTPAGHKVIFNLIYPMVEDLYNAIPSHDKTPQYSSYGNLKESMKYAFDFDSSAFTAGQSVFASGHSAQNYITVGDSSGGKTSDYDLKIVNTDHIKGLAIEMTNNHDMSPITLHLNSAVNGTSFLSDRKTIPADSKDQGLLMYVDTTNFRGPYYMQFQFEETDYKGDVTRRGLKANSEAYMQDQNNNFTLPVTINDNEYLILPQNYQGYIAIPFASFKTIWNTKDTNFAVDLTNVTAFYIYKSSTAGSGTLILDEFNFYGKTLTGNAYTAQQGQTKTTGIPTNRVSLFNFEDNIFQPGVDTTTSSTYSKQISHYLSGPTVNATKQYDMSVVQYNVPGTNSTKALEYNTNVTSSTSGQMGISLNTRQDLGVYQKLVQNGNLVASNSGSDGVAFYVDLTEYTATAPFELNVTWHEYDTDANGIPAATQGSDGVNAENTTSRNINSAYGYAEGVLDNGTSVNLTLANNRVVIPTLSDGTKFKGWVKLPFAAFQTCWSSNDVNNAIDFRNLFGINLYYYSNNQAGEKFTLDEFSFYGPAFSGISQKLSELETSVSTADLLDLSFRNGSVSDAAGAAAIQTVGSPQFGNVNLQYKNQAVSLPAMTINSTGQGLLAQYSSVSNQSGEQNLYRNGFTIEAFAENRSPSGEQGILSTCQTGGFGLFTENNKAKFLVYSDGSYKTNYSTLDLPTDQLVHIFAVYDGIGKKMYIYIDGELEATLNAPGLFAGGGGEAYNKITIGGDVDYYGQMTQSLMSNAVVVNAKVFSRALNGMQIKTEYQKDLNSYQLA